MPEPVYEIGTPVWSKMRGFCPWPSRIASPSESALKNPHADKTKTNKASYLVYFFGSNNFAWMLEDTIKAYEPFKEKNKNGSKSSQFKQGLVQIEEYISNGGQKALIEAISQENKPSSPFSDKSEAQDGDDNDASSSIKDGGLHSIEEELALINNKKPASNSASSRKSMKNSHDSQHDSSITSPVQKDYSRTPFKQGRKAVKTNADHESTTADNSNTATTPNKRIKITNDDDDHFESNSPNVSSTSVKTPTHKTGPRNLIFRNYDDAPVLDTPKLDKSHVLPKYKNINPSSLRFGFVGVGFMGQRLLKHLISTGHNVTIWNRTNHKCKDFIDAGAQPATTAADVVSASDIVFLCVSNPQASKETVFGPFGILAEMNENKALVEMSSIDPETSTDISEAIISKGGRYLEAPIICSSKKVADNGELVILAAGNRELFDDCKTCFDAMSKKTFYLSGTPGAATRMNLIVSTLYGSIVGAVSECCSLVDRASLELTKFQEILKLSVMNCPLVDDLLTRIFNKSLEVHMPLGSIQKDLRLVLNMSEEHNSSIPIAAVTNEVFKNALKVGYDSSDVSSVYLRNRY